MLDQLASKIKAIQDVAKSEESAKQKWLEDVRVLFNDVQDDYLRDEKIAGSLRFIIQQVQLTDGELGTYGIEQLLIQMEPGPAFILVPRGMNIVASASVKWQTGLCGRVDLINFADRNSVALYRRANRTWMLSSSIHPDGETLNRETFRRELAKLL